MACPSENELVEFIDDPGQRRVGLENHLASCDSCRSLIFLLRSGSESTRGSGDKQSALLPDSTIGRFVVVRELGRGAMGIVYLARDPELDREVAIKVRRGSFALDAGDEERLRREAQGLARLSHAHVVSVFEVGTEADRVYVVMEYVDGQTLADWLLTAKRTPTEILEVFLRAGAGLAAAHQANLVHRDFKPGNLLLSKDEDVKVTDFGLVRIDDEEGPNEIDEDSLVLLSQTGALIGTPAYLPPELFSGSLGSPKSDQFSFCVTLYESLCGRRPFPGATLPDIQTAFVDKKRPNWSELPTIPSRVRNAIARGLSIDPQDRFPDMEKLMSAIGGGMRRRGKGIQTAMVVGAMGSLVTAGALIFGGEEKPAKVCDGAANRLAEIWSDERRLAILQAFSATKLSYAADTWQRTAVAVDTFSDEWKSTWTAACRATAVSKEQSQALLDRRMLCLDHRHNELASVLDTWDAPDDEIVKRASETAANLTPVTVCNQSEALLAGPLPPPDKLRVVVSEVEKKIAKARAQNASSKIKPAMHILSELTQEVEALDYIPTQAKYYSLRADVFANLGELDNAEKDHRKAVQLGASAGDLQQVATNWASLYHLLGTQKRDIPASDALLETVTSAVLLAKDDFTSARFETLQAAVHRQADRIELAATHGRLAVEAFEGLYDQGHPQVGVAVNTLGLILNRLGKFDESERLHRRALAIFQEHHGELHRRTGFAHNNLGMLFFGMGRAKHASEEFAKAESILAQVIGGDSIRVAQIASNRAATLLELGKSADARDASLRALAIYRKKLPDNPGIATILAGLAQSYLEQEQWQRAEESLTEAVEISTKAFGPDNPRTLFVVSDLTNVLVSQGKCDGAKDLLAAIRQALSPEPGYSADMFANSIGDEIRCETDASKRRALMEEALTIRSGPHSQEPAALAAQQLALARELGKDAPKRARELATSSHSFYAKSEEFAEKARAIAAEFSLDVRGENSAPAR